MKQPIMNFIWLIILNSNLQYSIKGFVDKNIGNITIGSDGFTVIVSFIPTDKTILLTSIINFGLSSKRKCFNITADGVFLFGEAGDVITSVQLRYYYS